MSKYKYTSTQQNYFLLLTGVVEKTLRDAAPQTRQRAPYDAETTPRT